jgi:hypothetical protein
MSEIVLPPKLKSMNSLDRLMDFSDRLPPMLVKELRQGLRTNTFIFVFLGLQIFLALVLFFTASISEFGDGGDMISRIIFLFFAVAVLVVQPLRGVNAVHREIKMTTIDLMVLTKLSARRIVLGKWSSIVGQSLLLFVAIMPYLIMRYFFGQMNLFYELLVLFFVLIASMCVTAVVVGLSACKGILLRGFFPLAMAGLLFLLTCSLCFNVSSNQLLEVFTWESTDKTIIFFIGLMMIIYYAWLSLGMSISIIAPSSENHSSFNRVLTIIIMVSILTIAWVTNSDLKFIPLSLALCTLPAVVISFNEEKFLNQRVCLPFVKRGILGRFVGIFLYPCWSSGVFYSAILLGVVSFSSFLVFPDIENDNSFFQFNALIGCVLFPAVIVMLFSRKIIDNIGVYTFVAIGMIVFSVVINVISEASNVPSVMKFFLWLPPCQILNGSIKNYYDDPKTAFYLCCAINSFYLLILVMKALMDRSAIHRVEKVAREILFES